MFEIPLNFIATNPLLDITIFIFIIYIFLFKLYKNLLEEDVEKIAFVDLQVSLTVLLLGYLNYSGQVFSIFGFEVEWWFFVIFIQLSMEGFFIAIFWKDVKEYIKKKKKYNSKKKIENLKNSIHDMKMFQDFIEEDIQKSKMERDIKTEKELKKELKKVEEKIEKLKVDLKKIEQND